MTSSGPGEFAENNAWQSARDFGARLIDERKYADAIPALRTAVAGDPGGESHALLGLAHYLNEEYALAVAHYEEAVVRQPGNDDWSRMHGLARSQVESETNVAVPEHYLFIPHADRSETFSKVWKLRVMSEVMAWLCVVLSWSISVSIAVRKLVKSGW